MNSASMKKKLRSPITSSKKKKSNPVYIKIARDDFTEIKNRKKNNCEALSITINNEINSNQSDIKHLWQNKKKSFKVSEKKGTGGGGSV